MTSAILREPPESPQDNYARLAQEPSPPPPPPPFLSVHSPPSPHPTHRMNTHTHTWLRNAKLTNLVSTFPPNVESAQVRTVITLEPGSEVRRRRVRESRNRDREGLRLCSGETSRKLREEIGQKVTEGRMRRMEENEKMSIGGRGGEVEVRMRMRKDEGRRIVGGGVGGGGGGGGGGGNPEGRGRSWMLPRLSSPAVQVALHHQSSSLQFKWKHSPFKRLAPEQ